MNYKIVITMPYVGLGVNPDGSVVQNCTNVDYSKMGFSAYNVGKGRREDSINGSIRIRDNYNDFALYLNDETGYYVDPEGLSYTLTYNGDAMKVNKLKLSVNNKETKELTLSFHEIVLSEYTKIFANWNTEHNIISDVSAAGNITQYADFRVKNTKQTVVAPVTIASSEDLINYIQATIDSDDLWTPVLFTFVAGVAPAYTVTIDWEQWEAYGYYNGTSREPPPGVNWIYDQDVGGDPRYFKAPTIDYITYGSIILLVVFPTTVYVEQDQDIDYALVARKTEDVILYLVQKADATIDEDGDSWLGFLDVIGYGIFDNDRKFMRDSKLIAVADFIPNLDGTQKSNKTETAIISLFTILDYLESIGFYWYIEDDGGYKFRINHITTKSLGSGNPDLTDYYDKDRTIETEVIEYQELEFDKIINSTISSRYENRQSDYKYKIGTKEKSYASQSIITDLDYIIDAKEQAADVISGNQFVLCSTELVGATYFIRYFTSPLSGLIVNNFELSFYWLSIGLMEMPGKVGVDTTVYDDDRITKRKTVTLTVPMSNTQTDFDFLKYVTYRSKEAEIMRIEKNALNSFGEITIVYL